MSEYWVFFHISAWWLHARRNILPNWCTSLIIYYQPQRFFFFYFFNIWRWFLIRQTKFEFVQNWENMNFSSALLSLLKIFCIWEILALLRIYSLFENICVLLVLSVCCLLENSKVHIIQHSLPFWHIPVSRDQTQSPWGAWEVGSTSRAHHP